MRLVLLLLLLPLFSYSQKWIGSYEVKHSIDEKIAIKKTFGKEVKLTNNERVKSFLKTSLPNLLSNSTDVVLESETSSPKGKHLLFSQTLNGRKIFRGSVKVNLGLDGTILSLFDQTFSVSENEAVEFPDHQPYHDGLMAHYQTPNNGKLHRYELNEVYFMADDELIPAIHLEVVESIDRYYELILDNQTQVVYQNDLLAYSSAPADSIVNVWVFNPDPLTTTNQSYGAPYADANDIDVLELNAERVLSQAPVTFENDTFFLRNDYVSIEEFSLPNVPPAFSLTGDFNYTRAQSGFEDVNAFYHITYFQLYIQSLGFTNIVDYPIAVDAHALNGGD
ncbi:MAG: hypothetical protein ACPGD8_05715, partial [Flavobacteriales bacterium]